MVATRLILAAGGLAMGSASFMSANASTRLGASPVGSRDVFVHLFEWSWSDVATECETYLGPKGFTAVQISPPNDHIAGDAWWTRYQPVTYDLVSRSGDENGFQDMIKRCNAAGVGIYADAVINHIAAGSGKSVSGKSYGGRSTPIYSADEMHHNDGDSSKNCAVSNYNDKHNVQYCDLVGLPDLCTSCNSVQEKVSGYISKMAQMGISGFRVDAAKHMDAGELGTMLSNVDSGLFRFHEVISGAGQPISAGDYTSIGHVTEFDFFRKLDANVKDEGKLQYLDGFGESWGLISGGKAVTFIDNHDTQRGEAPLTYRDGRVYELASIFMLAHPYGYPKIMSSYFFDAGNTDQGPPSTPVHSNNAVNCFHGQPWVCEHRWSTIGNMVNWRKSAGTSGVTNFQKFSGNTIAFCRGTAACVAMNRGGDTWNANVKFSVPAGTYCNVIEDDEPSTCPKITVNSDGSASFQVEYQRAVAVHIGKKATDNIIV